MTLKEFMTLAESFATTIFSVKLMHDCTYNRKTILDDDDEDTSSEDGTEESDFGEGNSRSSTRYMAIEKM